MFKRVTLAMIMMLFVLSACNSKRAEAPQSTYEQIQKKLSGLQTYKSEATVKYVSNKDANEYNTLQHCKITGEYRVEVIGPQNVAGNVTLFDGQNIGQFNPKIGAELRLVKAEARDRSEIFLTSFIRNYFNSDETSVSVSNLGDTDCTVLEAVVPGGHPYLTNEKLWVDNDTKMPVRLVVYDPEGVERIVVTYKTFEYNIELEDSLFSV
ncbi:MAG: hypothetical protein LBV08_10600 [Clostridiales bacterium]|jgi:outer membrane lipoprotein-sorting protein|nr:hypothetical protein [Clostridiales bacterium]